jgi:hypothetical protein
VRQVEAALKEFPEIDSVIAVVGTWDGRNTAQVDIKLQDRKTTSAARSRNWRRDPRAPEPIAGITLSVG